MADDFKWEDPPNKVSGRHSNALKLAKKLASRPNKWARIATYKSYMSAHSRASDIRRGNLKAYAEIGKFEADVREVPEGYGLWVRCVYVKKGLRETLLEESA